MSEQGPAHVRQAPEGVSGRLLGWVIVGSIAATLIGVGVARALLDTDRTALGDVARTPHYPVSRTVGDIEQLPIEDSAGGQALGRERRASLERYGWVDKQRGIARIPIDRAMQWLAEDAKRGALRSPDPATTVDGGAPAETR
jgi:hypothetical protein